MDIKDTIYAEERLVINTHSSKDSLIIGIYASDKTNLKEKFYSFANHCDKKEGLRFKALSDTFGYFYITNQTFYYGLYYSTQTYFLNLYDMEETNSKIDTFTSAICKQRYNQIKKEFFPLNLTGDINSFNVGNLLVTTSDMFDM